MKHSLDILVVGGGMYVSGRGTNSYGTIFPALLEARGKGHVGRIILATTNSASARQALSALCQLAEKMGVDIDADYFPKNGHDDRAFMDALNYCTPDAVVISVPDHLHAEVGIPLIERGLHCLMVKPLAPTTSQAKALARVAAQSGVVCQVEFHKRLDESNLILRDSVRSGRIGEPLYAVIEYSQQKRIPRDIFAAWASLSNVFQYLGVHYVDLLYYTTGYEPRRITAWGQKNYLVAHGVDTWDAIQAVIEWDKGNGQQFISTHITNWIDPDESSAVSDQKINVVGTGGRIQADQKHRGLQQVRDSEGVRDLNPYFSSAFGSGQVEDPLRFSGYGIASVLQFIDDVLSFCNGQSRLDELNRKRPSFDAGVVSSAVVEACNLSLVNSKSIDIEL